MPSKAVGKPYSSSSATRSGPTPKPVVSGSPSTPMPWPSLIPLGHHEGKPPIPIMRPVLLIGSRHNAHLHLLSRQISKAHALIVNSDERIYVHDLCSRTHVFVNGMEVQSAYLKGGDVLRVGSFTFRFAAGPPPK